MLDEKILSILSRKNFASIATIMPNGYPHVTHVWIDYDQEHNILINTAIGRLKERNTRTNKQVAISIVDSKNPYETVSIMGVIIGKITKGAQDHFDKLAKKYLNLDKYPIINSNEQRVILKIKPEKIFYNLIPLEAKESV
ncbi:pyridoxamine 5'-phosphate oxidase family protein [Candidatus Nitrosocosmicus franklandus]|uniref:Pyridoxamine 5'-phosphate oxidase n=1 Tax=Candidatus Nitrosocosmicus franklandianus TaxID=1798806 RepID=A0A484I4S4_9ARCH|nr:pyridoxamine 5'-phosphate oxidase family protein [Candidatus Nitrosocosmicus franklandus]VFJ12655.1 Pyridoxamine 5'-phosphate oxidase [Candidatus Nitrosocosmicus franklandus]